MASRANSGTRRRQIDVWLSATVLLIMVGIALLAPLVSPYDPGKMEIGQSNFPPAWYHTGTRVGHPDHVLGTDRFGRDILSHAVHGARAAIFLVLVAIPLTTFLGVLIGLLAGLGNTIVSRIFLGIMDVISAVPAFMFAVILVFILRVTAAGEILGGLITLTLAFALANWVSLARLVYASVLKIKQQEFIVAAHSLGATTQHQIFKHILPHVFHLIIVWIINSIPALILLEALMGYIGIQILQKTDGSSFQDVSWGGLILVGRSQLNSNPFILLVPILCILAISMSCSVLGDYLRERTNPQLASSQIV